MRRNPLTDSASNAVTNTVTFGRVDFERVADGHQLSPARTLCHSVSNALRNGRVTHAPKPKPNTQLIPTGSELRFFVGALLNRSPHMVVFRRFTQVSIACARAHCLRTTTKP